MTSNGNNGRANVGFQVWNMSKRISSVRGRAPHIQEFLAERIASDDWSPDDLSTLREIAQAYDESARRADETWEQLVTVVAESDATLIEPSPDGCGVIRNHGLNPDLMAKVDAVWHADTSVAESRILDRRLDDLIDKNNGAKAVEGDTEHDVAFVYETPKDWN